MGKIVKKQDTSLAKLEPWEMELAEKARNEQSSETLGVPRVTHRGGILKVDDQPIAGNKLPVVVVGYAFSKQYFKEGFDPDAPAATPVCYAFTLPGPGAEQKMVPHEASPEKQSAQCTGCPHNKFGTAEKGRGKRCSDTRRLMIAVETKDPASIMNAQVRQISVPPGSLKNWGNYLKALKEISPLGVRGVVTEISPVPTDRGAHALTFTPVGKLSREQVQAVLGKEKQVEADLMAPFPVLEAGEPEPRKKGKAKY